MSNRISGHVGRTVFGDDATNYAAARPTYPERVYALLREVVDLSPATNIFEIGPGTGQATEHLLVTGATITAIEPDERFVAILESRLGRSPRLEIISSTFENAALPLAQYDLGVAATSFHWLDQMGALAKVHQRLRPGGWWAMWWTVFGDPQEIDPFRQQTQHLFENIGSSPSHPRGARVPFALDRSQRLEELKRAGFTHVVCEEIRWSPILTTAQAVGLTATFSPVVMLGDEERAHLLGEVGRIADSAFGGQVQRNFVTPIYLARKPK